MSVRFSFERLPSTSSYTLSSVTSVPTGSLATGRAIVGEHLIGLLDDRPVAASVMARSPWLKPDARHDADTEVDVMGRIRVEPHEVVLAKFRVAGGALETEGGIQGAFDCLGKQLTEERRLHASFFASTRFVATSRMSDGARSTR